MTQKPVRVGMLVPSSNTVLEPYTSAMFSTLGDTASVHYARFRVVEISMSAASRGQFDLAPILEAAERLAETEPDLIVWNGTSASWLGLETDHALCAAITDRTGVPATSTSLAFDALFRGLGLTRIGVVTPYLPEIQTRIIERFATRGITVVAEAHLSDKGNHSFASYGPDVVAGLVRDVARAGPEAIAIICTNFRGAGVAPALEDELSVPVIDSVSVTAAYAMHRTGLRPSAVTGWGSIFQRAADFA
jgi:maleate isomerase